MSLKVTEDKLRSLKEDNVDILVHLCPNCHVQFDRYQNLISKRTNEDFDIIHLNIAQFMAIVMGADFNKVVGVQAHTVPVENKLKDLKKVVRDINE